ncbi:TPM domain-containing protein [Pasteurella skyensis]|uniref:TPM domain-containing protein n=1 Tax=Phocoenobacter skyensis TaxID=97481 RepID=UPI00278DA52C|nr:TPM domain-containing protein [Pasteurella skyensis]MDP8170018.1 TPM domain-containing protein [Pasteurella skyensis]
MKLFSFFSKKLPVDIQQIEQAIAHLEQHTSAELRVVVERKAKTHSAIERAEQLFNELEMYQTAQHNAVLIYLSFKPHYVAVIGDKGIHQKVGDEFWQAVYDAMKQQCQRGNFTQAICNGIKEVETQLVKYYPIQTDDIDELSNEVIIK